MGETSPDSVFANIIMQNGRGNPMSSSLQKAANESSNDRYNNNNNNHPFLNLPNQRSTSAPLERQHYDHHSFQEDQFHPNSSLLWGTDNGGGSSTIDATASDQFLDQVTRQYDRLSLGDSRLHRSTSAFGSNDEPNHSFFGTQEERGATAPPSSWNATSQLDEWSPPHTAVRPAAKTLMELIQEQDGGGSNSMRNVAATSVQQQRLMVPPGYPAQTEQRWVLESTDTASAPRPTTPNTMYQLQPRPQQVLLGNPSDFCVLSSTASAYPNTYLQPPQQQQPQYWPPTTSNPSSGNRNHHRASQQQSHRRRPTHPARHNNHHRNQHHHDNNYHHVPKQQQQAQPPASCNLLEEFRNSKRSDWTIRRIMHHIVEFCQDQNGSRFIQQRLELGDSVDLVLNEVLPHIHILRIDVFGNYVVQKLLDFGTPEMRSEIKRTLEGEMVSLSLQMYGCRVIQKALETLPEDELPTLLKEFHHNVLSLIHDQNGNHVMQKCVEVLNTRAVTALRNGDAVRAEFLYDQVDFIVQDVLVNTKSLSCHPYGCRVFQRMLEHCHDGRKLELLNIIRQAHETLLDDQYGNYVIQHVLQYGRDEDRNSILSIIQKHGLLGLSRQKFASNVVEKLLKYGNSHHRRAVIREMLKKTEDPALHAAAKHVSIVLLMVRDAYANYVVQTTLDVAPESPERRALLYELNSHVEELRNYTFAKHIVAKLTSGR